MNDPVQMLIDAGAIPTSPFAPTSRYLNVPVLRYESPLHPQGVAFLARRFLPRLSEMVIAAEHVVQGGDRTDLLAARYFGNAELHWRIADANSNPDMIALTAQAGDRLNIPVPPGAGGA
jgi:hypothetical protein